MQVLKETKRILVAMSGGVDSSVCAYLARREGYECVGATMALHSDRTKSCGGACVASEISDAHTVAQALGVEHHTLDYSDSFEEAVVRPFVATYEAGMTPNPCVLCNRHMKFSKLFSAAEELRCDLVATGHYVRSRYDGEKGRYLLLRGKDESKDQSYVLYMLTQDQLARVRFPLGEYGKEEVRAIAKESGLPVAGKRDSQDICFIPDKDYAGFIHRYTGKEPRRGNYVDREGRVLGTHKGLIHYTVGQHKGLGLSTEIPLYVCELRPETDEVVLGEQEELFSRDLVAEDVNLIDCERMDEPRRVCAKVRYRHREQPALAWVDGDGRLRVRFDEPQRAITPGQAVVLYDGDVVVGGGTIVRG